VTSESGAAAEFKFNGNQVRLISCADENGGLADVYMDGRKQLVGIDFWNPRLINGQTLYYKNGLAEGEHTLKIVAQGAGNPYSKGKAVYIDGIEWSDAKGEYGYEPGGGPTDTQRWIFGYTGREDYKDSEGNKWRPATEFITPFGRDTDSVAWGWWTSKAPVTIEGTDDPELYSYGVHARRFTVNFTVGPGTYHVRLKFAATRGISAKNNPFNVSINGERVLDKLDVASAAGGENKAIDFVFNGITPRNGIIEVRFRGIYNDDNHRVTEAFVQAIEVGPGDGGKATNPAVHTPQLPTQ